LQTIISLTWLSPEDVSMYQNHPVFPSWQCKLSCCHSSVRRTSRLVVHDQHCCCSSR